jgi:hypothetical protein
MSKAIGRLIETRDRKATAQIRTPMRPEANLPSFPILATHVFSWHPVAGAKPPKIDGPPGGVVSLAFWSVQPGPKELCSSAKWEIAVALDGSGLVATYKK